VSQMMDPAMMGPPPPDPGAAGPPPPGAGGGLPPELMAALGGGGGQNSPDMLAQGPMAGAPTEEADEPTGDDPLSMVRDAIDLLRKAGMAEPDDQRSHMIDKVQADLQKILASESQKTDKLRSALGG
jgi:hypothetical protein